MLKGQCHCGAVRYEMPEEAIHQALCHCTDCRRHSGAPMVAWGLVAKDQLKVEGETKEYASSEKGRRHFCPRCGTALFYTNDEVFPGQIDVQIATLDDPNAIVPNVPGPGGGANRLDGESRSNGSIRTLSGIGKSNSGTAIGASP